MQKRLVRMTVLTLLLAASLAAAFFLWRIQQQRDALAAAEDMLAERFAVVGDTIGGIGTAQQGYVAPGQLDEPWFERMSMLLEALNQELAIIGPALRSPDATAAFATLTDSVEALVAADERARENLSRGQDLMAADVIFSDGRNILDAITAKLHEAQRAERGGTRTELATLERQRWITLGLATLVWFGVVVSLIRGSASGAADPVEPRRTIPLPASRPAGAGSPVDLAAAAALCTDLSRVAEAAALSALLGRTASILDASGVTLWLGAGEQLFAVLGHGYTQETLARLGPVARDADNAVARVWRTSRLATVAGAGTAGGAVVAPMFGPGGCIGVLAVESRQAREPDPALQAVAAMIAAQVATAIAAWPAPSAPQPLADTPTARSA
ncbi:MAG: GAF domain-containing protein [Vicinamibacterales bacterium]